MCRSIRSQIAGLPSSESVYEASPSTSRSRRSEPPVGALLEVLVAPARVDEPVRSRARAAARWPSCGAAASARGVLGTSAGSAPSEATTTCRRPALPPACAAHPPPARNRALDGGPVVDARAGRLGGTGQGADPARRLQRAVVLGEAAVQRVARHRRRQLVALDELSRSRPPGAPPHAGRRPPPPPRRRWHARPTRRAVSPRPAPPPARTSGPVPRAWPRTCAAPVPARSARAHPSRTAQPPASRKPPLRPLAPPATVSRSSTTVSTPAERGRARRRGPPRRRRSRTPPSRPALERRPALVGLVEPVGAPRGSVHGASPASTARA